MTAAKSSSRAHPPAWSPVVQISLENTSRPTSEGDRRPVVELFRPVGQQEADLIAAAGNRRFPPRLPFQPIFYPVTNFQSASEIAERWNTKDEASGYVGYVTRFLVDRDYLRQFEVHQVGAAHHREYWIPAEQLEEFNAHIVGTIEVVAEFRLET